MSDLTKSREVAKELLRKSREKPEKGGWVGNPDDSVTGAMATLDPLAMSDGLEKGDVIDASGRFGKPEESDAESVVDGEDAPVSSIQDARDSKRLDESGPDLPQFKRSEEEDYGDRIQRIRTSLDKINTFMAELKKMNKKDDFDKSDEPPKDPLDQKGEMIRDARTSFDDVRNKTEKLKENNGMSLEKSKDEEELYRDSKIGDNGFEDDPWQSEEDESSTFETKELEKAPKEEEITSEKLLKSLDDLEKTLVKAEKTACTTDPKDSKDSLEKACSAVQKAAKKKKSNKTAILTD